MPEKKTNPSAVKQNIITCPACGAVNAWTAKKSSECCMACGCKIIVERSEQASGGYRVYAVETAAEKKKPESKKEHQLLGVVSYALFIILTLLRKFGQPFEFVWCLCLIFCVIYSLAIVSGNLKSFEKVLGRVTAWGDRTGHRVLAAAGYVLCYVIVVVGFPFGLPLLLVWLLERFVLHC